MTADEFATLVPADAHHQRFLVETYSVRVVPYTPPETSVVEDIILRRVEIVQYVYPPRKWKAP